jgi:hypothetical protein
LERNIPSVIDSNETSSIAKTLVSHVWNTLGKKYFERATVAYEDER